MHLGLFDLLLLYGGWEVPFEAWKKTFEGSLQYLMAPNCCDDVYYWKKRNADDLLIGPHLVPLHGDLEMPLHGLNWMVDRYIERMWT